MDDAESQEKLVSNEKGTDPYNSTVILCVQCKQASKEAQSFVTSCCGQHLCQVCVSSSILKDKRQCPSCGETEVTFESGLNHVESSKHRNECAVKENGYTTTTTTTATAKNGDTLDLSHTDTDDIDTDSVESEHIFVQCTNSCGQELHKRNLSTHLENECPKRKFVCPQCNLVATYEVIMGKHHIGCSTFTCPNQCGLTDEMFDVDEHLKVCPSQEIVCEFSTIGCLETFPRKNQGEHMKDNTQAHLILMSDTLVTLREFHQKQLSAFDLKLQQNCLENEHRLKEQQDDFQARLQEQQDKFKRMLKRQQTEFEQRLKDEQDKRLQLEATLQAKDQFIKDNTTVLNQLQEQLNMVILHSPPYQFTMTNFKQLKTDNKAWNSLPMYTHPGGYKVCVRVRPNGLPWSRGFKTHMSVWFFAMKGDYDETLVWPAEATITLQLLNQHHDKKHLTITRRYLWRKDVVDTSNHTAIGVILDKLISHEDLELNSQEETQYLKDNCLRFRITDITVHS